MSPLRKSMRPMPQEAGSRSRASATSVARSIRHHLGAAACGLDRRAPVPQPASKGCGGPDGRPRQQQGVAVRSPGSHGGTDAADRGVGGEPRPGGGRGAVEVGLTLPRRSGRGEVSIGGGCPSCSPVEASAGRRCRGPSWGRRSSDRRRPQARGQLQVFLLHASARGCRHHLEQWTFFRRLATDDVQRRDLRHGLQADPVVVLVDLVGLVDRLAMTPPSRTS